MSGLLVVFAGPSGVGKGTVMPHVLAAIEDAETSVSVTTRDPRPGEVEGRDYHFVDRAIFEELVEQGAFLEHALFTGHCYGTLLESVRKRLTAGAVVILEIEIQGAAQIAQRVPEALRIFLAPPTMDELRRRLNRRGTEGVREVERRMERAEHEIAAADLFHHVVVNDDSCAAAAKVVDLIEAARGPVRNCDG